MQEGARLALGREDHEAVSLRAPWRMSFASGGGAMLTDAATRRIGWVGQRGPRMQQQQQWCERIREL